MRRRKYWQRRKRKYYTRNLCTYTVKRERYICTGRTGRGDEKDSGKKKVGGCPGFDTKRRSQRQSHGEKKKRCIAPPIQTISTFLLTFFFYFLFFSDSNRQQSCLYANTLLCSGFFFFFRVVARHSRAIHRPSMPSTQVKSCKEYIETNRRKNLPGTHVT